MRVSGVPPVVGSDAGAVLEVVVVGLVVLGVVVVVVVDVVGVVDGATDCANGESSLIASFASARSAFRSL